MESTKPVLGERAGSIEDSASTPRVAATGRVLVTGRTVATVALVSIVVGRALATALPGSRAGIDSLIRAGSYTAAMLTQLTVVLAASTLVLALATTLWQRAFGYAYRIAAIACGAAVVTLVVLSTRGRLDPIEATFLGVAAAMAGAAAVTIALWSRRTRGAALVLAATTIASLAYLGSRLLAARATEADPSVFETARGLATVGFCLDLLAIGLAVAWLTRPNPKRWVAPILIVIAGAAVISWGAIRGSADGAALWQVLASRSMNELTPGPAPFVADSARYWVEALALQIAALVLWAPGRVVVVQVAMGLVIMARASTDIPLCALMLTLGALLLPLEALRAAVERIAALTAAHSDP